jgi:Protein of unknown function (DUF2752)
MRTIRQRLGICFRPLAPGEIDFECLFLGVSLAAAGSCFAWLAFGLPWPKCWFRQLTGLPCPTCGATRSVLSFVHWNLGDAICLNPLLFLCYAGTLVLDLYCTFVLLFRLPRLRLPRQPARIKYRLCILVVVAIAMNWIYLVASPRNHALGEAARIPHHCYTPAMPVL